MEIYNPGKRIGSIILLLLILFGIGSNFYIITNAGISFVIKIGAAISFLALISVAFYCISGYQKKSANFYKIFLLLFGITYLVSSQCIILNTNLTGALQGELVSSISLMMYMIEFACCFTLYFAKDLGKKKSFVMSGILVGFSVIQFIPAFTVTVTLAEFGIGRLELLMRSIINVTCSLIVLFANMEKYRDKENRGTI